MAEQGGGPALLFWVQGSCRFAGCPRGGLSLCMRDPDGALIELATTGLWWGVEAHFGGSWSERTRASASGWMYTGPVKGWSMEIITTKPMVTRTDSTPVIETCASRFSLPKKSVKPTVRSAPVKSTLHMTFGTSPVARCSLIR